MQFDEVRNYLLTLEGVIEVVIKDDNNHVLSVTPTLRE